MSDWTSGYVADIAYTFGYYNELNPARSKLAFLFAGLQPPSEGVHCELGFGQGMSVNIHAAASGSTWYANDFNPAQASFAQSLAKAAGASAHISDESFDQFCTREDLPEFDSIGLHGIWSWISDENRATIVDFIRRKLKVGGALYISYNTLPGWSTFAPMRHLLSQHASVMGASGKGVVSSLEGALDFASKLLETKPMYSLVNPSVSTRLEKIKLQDRHYVVHEYMNKDWLPMYFATMAQWLQPAKIDFACSAHYVEHLAEANLKPEQQTMLKEIEDRVFRETVRDYMVNQQFRRDYWVKGLRKLKPLEKTELLLAHRLVLTSARADIGLKFTATLGDVNLSKTIYGPILDLMSDHKIRSVGNILEKLSGKGLSFQQILEASMVLIGMGHMASAQDEAVIAKAQKTTQKLNAALIEKARSSAEVNYLASAVTGGGIALNRFQQLFVSALKLGKKKPEEWATHAWQVLSLQGQKLVVAGSTLQTEEENLKELTRQAAEFDEKNLPVLKALQVV